MNPVCKLPPITALLAVCLCGSAALQAQDVVYLADELWQRSAGVGLQLSADRSAIELIRGTLLENDGDAAGYSYRANEEKLRSGIVVRKRFEITAPLPPRAFLLVGHQGKVLQAKINGKPVELAEPTKAGNYWKRYEIPVDSLHSGENTIDLAGDGKIWIARDDECPASNPPVGKKSNTSAKSKDGGKTWSHDRLGTGDDIAGEYYVRLFLDGYSTAGATLELPLVDAALPWAVIIPPQESVIRSIRIHADGEWDDAKSAVSILVGMSDEPWRVSSNSKGPIARQEFAGADAKIENPRERFMQIQVRLNATDPARSPRLRSVTIDSDRRWLTADWRGNYAMDTTRVAELLPQSGLSGPQIPFAYESLTHPRLRMLRREQGLDEVVRGCTTDLERMEKLAVWSSQLWKKGHLSEIYPRWDALEILRPHADGTPIGGFCQQFNLVFLQACESLGMVGRCVSIGAGDHGVNIRSGHEVVEIWSNEWNKWIYVDGQAAWYFVDKQNRQPLNLLELRERQIATLRDQPTRDVEVVVLAESPYQWKGLSEWPAFTELRMIPHTQFLDHTRPLPLNQGMRGWFWTGHYVWTDRQMPGSVLYKHFVANERDWNWPINQTQFWIQRTATEREMVVKLVNNMPSFRRYLVQIDDGPEQATEKDELTWRLKPGPNELRVRAENQLGIAGPVSWQKLKYQPPVPN